jgi:hypothetical protein
MAVRFKRQILPYSAAFFGASGFQRSTGWRAASVSSKRRRGVW